MAEGDILGVRGGTDFMVDAGVGDALGQTGVTLARVFSLSTGGYLGDPVPVASLAARGYWEGPDTVEDALLAEVRDRLAALPV